MVSYLDCFYVSHSHCESVVTDTIAKETSFFTVNSSMDDVFLHGVWLQHRSQTSTWLQVAAQIMDIPWTLEITRAIDINLILGGSSDH